MLFDNCNNYKEQGNIGLGAAISYFTKNHYIVSTPLNDSQDYDLVVDDGKSLFKVQVKTTKLLSKNKNNYVVNLKVGGGNSKQNYIHKLGNDVVYDLLFVLCNDGRMFLIPKDKIYQHKSSLFVGTLNKEYQVY